MQKKINKSKIKKENEQIKSIMRNCYMTENIFMLNVSYERANCHIYGKHFGGGLRLETCRYQRAEITPICFQGKKSFIINV